ncbi:MAG: TM2 domain-containing protein [Armatimonadetes bacterium]|nr:TM2 domain-containing protein [Armatimonadota bacterium]
MLDGLKPRRSRTVAGVLGILFGWLGVHRFYLGHTGVGTLMLAITLLTCFVATPLTFLWGLIEGILCLTGAMTDAEGRRLGV